MADRDLVRDVPWEGFYNARDLGGLPTTDGRVTRTGVVVRSAEVRFVTAPGWEAARRAGFTTVVDLREPREVGEAGAPPGRPPGLEWRHVPLDDQGDLAFWEPFMADERLSTPLYYPAFLRAKGDRVAAVFAELAAAPGGVVVHCGAGRDRTGLVSALLLALAGVEPAVIVEDYTLSALRLRPLFDRLGRPDDAPRLEAIVATYGTTAAGAVLDVLEGLDVHAYLRDTGVPASDVDRLATRLRG